MTVITVAAQDTVGGTPDLTCTGSADTATIQAAINSCSALGGGTVLFLPGTYDINAQINRVSGVSLLGSGYGTHFRLTNANNGSFGLIGDSNTTTGATGVAIENIRFDGNNANNASGTQRGLRLYTHCGDLRNNWFEHFGRAATPSCIAINITSATAGTITGNTMLDTVDGFNSGGAATWCSGLTVLGNTSLSTVRDYAFNIPNCSGCLFSGNVAWHSKLNPFNVGPGTVNCRFYNSTVRASNTAATGIYINPTSSGNIFVGNTITGTHASYTAGIRFENISGEETGGANLALGNTAVLPDGSYDITPDLLQIYGVTGQTWYVTVQNAAGQWWNGSDFVVYNVANWATYVLALTESGTIPGRYSTATPAALTVGGGYVVTAYQQAAGAPAASDAALVSCSGLTWSGSAWAIHLAAYPKTANLLAGDALGLSDGRLTLPAAADVRAGVAVGDGSGTLAVPAAGRFPWL